MPETQRTTPFWESLAQGTAAGAIDSGLGAIMGLALGGYNDRRQIKQQQKLTDMQMRAQMGLMDAQSKSQLQFWKDTSYGAQVEQLKKAGLNPGLIYGMGGAGGGTIGGGMPSTGGATASQNPGDIQAMAGMGIQSAMAAAQMRLINAQADNLDAQTKDILPVQKTNIQSQTGLNIANTGNVQADTKLKGLQAEMQTLQNELMGKTIDQQAEMVSQGVEKLKTEIKKIGLENKLSEATMNTRIMQASAELLTQYLINATEAEKPANIRAQTNLLGEQAKTEDKKRQLMTEEMRKMVDDTLYQIIDIYGDEGKTMKEKQLEVDKTYKNNLIKLGVGAEVIEGVGQILDHIPYLNMWKMGIPRGTKPGGEAPGFKIGGRNR